MHRSQLRVVQKGRACRLNARRERLVLVQKLIQMEPDEYVCVLCLRKKKKNVFQIHIDENLLNRGAAQAVTN